MWNESKGSEYIESASPCASIGKQDLFKIEVPIPNYRKGVRPSVHLLGFMVLKKYRDEITGIIMLVGFHGSG